MSTLGLLKKIDLFDLYKSVQSLDCSISFGWHLNIANNRTIRSFGIADVLQESTA